MKKAVALQYTTDLPAPFILAKGRDNLAERLRRIAEENDITVIRDEHLTESLYLFDAGVFIPEFLYETVAELLAFVYAVDHGKKNMIQDNL